MKLQAKLALFNAIAIAVLFAGFILLIPFTVEKISVAHTDSRLEHMQTQMLNMVRRVGIEKFIREEADSSFSSYNILKEEFIFIQPLPRHEPQLTRLENTQRIIDGEVVDFRVLSYEFEVGSKHYRLEIGKDIRGIEELGTTLRRFGLVLIIVTLLISILLNTTFASYLLRPFRKIITQKLQGTQHPETFNFETVNTTTQDFRLLDESINEMMHKIQDAFRKEKEFIANVSHELLTPVSILQTRLENMLAESDMEQAISDRIVEAQKTLARLHRIIRALLMISRIENDQYLKNEHIDLHELLSEIKDEIEERLTEKNIRITIEGRDTARFGPCNRSLLFTMLFNLVNNAIKYNRENGTITLRISEAGEHWAVDVEDTGNGISAENIPHLFERFRRFQQPAQSEGYGLGLPIVKTIADFHGIAINVSSEPGKGSRFRLLFPLGD